MDIREFIQNNHLLLDGAMGTMLQNKGLKPGQLPELMNITNPEAVRDIHAQYVAAGCHVVTSNTFGANRHKLSGSGYTVEQVIEAAIKNGKESGARWVAMDMGPTGQLLEPMGTLSFEAAYDLYAEQVKAGVRAGADLILIETISDLYEAKAAVLAAKEHSNLPVFCTLTFEADGRTFVGCDPMTAALTLSGLGVDAVGVNCSLGPEALLPVVETMVRYAKVPVMVQANAGLPREEGDAAVYDIDADAYVGAVERMLALGVRIVGGCCGTTPVYIEKIGTLLLNRPLIEPERERVTAACSGTATCIFDGKTVVIGERINPTGKKRLKEALRLGQMDYILGEAIDQTQTGANVLDVNVGLPELDEPAMIRAVVKEVQGVTGLPLQIDSADPAAVEAGARLCNGKPMINSVNGKAEVMDRIFPIVKKYGALIVCLTLDESGIPPTAEGRFQIAQRIYEKAVAFGIPQEDILIDCLVLTASAQQEQVLETLKAVRLVKSRLGLSTVLGVSNVSFGLPDRPGLNRTFLGAALGAGLDAAILNPMSEDMMRTVDAFRVLSNEDKDAAAFTRKYGNVEAKPAATTERTLFDCLVDGRREETVVKVRALLTGGRSSLDIVDGQLIPALDLVGARFEKGKIFLPQLMQSATAAQSAFDEIKSALEASGEDRPYKGKVLLATVEGDIHDIGKNIVKMLLRNYGYDVLDLGFDVKIERVVEEALRHEVRLVGLSALMTTTVKNMQKTIAALKAAGALCKVMVGGAVLSEEYAAMVGADYYAKDAQSGVRITNEVFAGL